MAYKFFKNKGIKTPKFAFFSGNSKQLIEEVTNFMFFINDYCNKVKLFKYIKQYSNTLQKWTKELGKTYGYFEGY